MLIFFIFFLVQVVLNKQTRATVYDNSTPRKIDLKLVLGEYNCNDPNVVGCAIFNDEIEKDGWDKLRIKTFSKNGKFSDALQSSAAGYLEGALSTNQIYYIYANHADYWGFGKNGTFPELIHPFMKNNLQWTRDMANKFKETDTYWNEVNNILMQFDWMLIGQNEFQQLENRKLNEMMLFYLQSAGDLYGVLAKYESMNNLIKGPMEDYGLDCSSLIRLIPNENGTFADIYLAQDTWRSFQLQNKVFKHYDFELNNVKSKVQSFSSSPGMISSKDDYYVMDTNLVVMETTNSVFNKEILKKITPECVFTWIRSPLSNRLAGNGKEWTDLFSKYSSATYTNQWMVINLNKFSPNKRIEEGFFYVLEEIPTYIHVEDMTNKLMEMKYWPSYNIPFFEDVYKLSGWSEKEGDEYDYHKCARRKLFDQLAPKIPSFREFASTMRYNEYKTNPIQQNDPAKAIASRYDLRENPHAFGAIDAKITSWEMAKTLSQYIVAGGTHESKDIPFFSWRKFPDVQHLGQPEDYDFNWVYESYTA